MKKTDVYVVVDTPKKAKKLKKVLDMFGERTYSESSIQDCLDNTENVLGFDEEENAFMSGYVYQFEDSRIKASIKELRNILAVEHNESKKELEVGKWYNVGFEDKDEFFALIYITNIVGDRFYFYGFDNDDKWRKKDWFRNSLNYTEATTQEVEESLIKEAKRRYEVGDLLRDEDGDTKRFGFFTLHYRPEFNTLFQAGINIFKDGKWATIIEQGNFTYSDVSIVERLHDTLLDNHGYSLESKLLTDARMLANKIKSNIK